MSVVWVVDDDRNLLKILSLTLKAGGHEVASFSAGQDAIAAMNAGVPDALVTDLQMPGMDGVELLRAAKEIHGELPIILLTAHGSIDRAVEAMKAGAYDFLTKPVDNEKLFVTVRNAIHHGQLLRDLAKLRENRRDALGATIVGSSTAMRRVRDAVARVSGHDTTVLVTGETGVGKEVVARGIHAASPRMSAPFIAVNCGAIPETLIESELFGHVRGAFTGAVRDQKGKVEIASGGTLFLDEVGELSLAAQTRLLRVVQERIVIPVGSEKERKVDVRVIAATNRDLTTAIATGRFRQDLFYRLNVFPLEIPPLRERLDDLPPLVAHLLGRLTDDPPDVAPEAFEKLKSHSWPGNVRELDNILQRALIHADEGVIRPEHIIGMGNAGAARAEIAPPIEQAGPDEIIELAEIERAMILRALKKAECNQTKAARMLGITRMALIYRMDKHGIKPEAK
jgi:two-component system NtrC family response regulator